MIPARPALPPPPHLARRSAEERARAEQQERDQGERSEARASRQTRDRDQQGRGAATAAGQQQPAALLGQAEDPFGHRVPVRQQRVGPDEDPLYQPGQPDADPEMLLLDDDEDGIYSDYSTSPIPSASNQTFSSSGDTEEEEEMDDLVAVEQKVQKLPLLLKI